MAEATKLPTTPGERHVHKIRNAMLAFAAVATLGSATLVTTTTSADARGGFHGGGGGFHGGGGRGGMRASAAARASSVAAPSSVAACTSAIRVTHRSSRAPHHGHRPHFPSATGAAGIRWRCKSTCAGRARCLRGAPAGRATTYAVAPVARRSAALHLPDQGIHAGQSGGVQGRVHQGSRVGAGRQHAGPAPAAAAEQAPVRSSKPTLHGIENPGLRRGSLS